jgi:hypothetical protein
MPDLGTKITTAIGAFSGPKLSIDPMLNPGTLLLVDASHDVSPWVPGVPVATVPNLADAANPLTVTNTLTPTSGVVERTAKGGLHAIVSQVGGSVNLKYTLSAAALRAYLVANPGHAYYSSLWSRITRLSIESPPGPVNRFTGFLSSGNSDTMSNRLATGNKATATPSTNRTAFKETSTPATVGVANHTLGAWSSIAAPGSSPEMLLMGHASLSVANKNASWIFYRMVIEDLTVSAAAAGVSVTDQATAMRAIDEALFAEAVGSGGRLNGDTYTAVSTLP